MMDMMNPHDFEKAERAHELANSLSIPFCAAWKIAACVTKVAYSSKEEAVKRMKSQPNQKPYKCPICARWHMTTCATSPQSKTSQKKKSTTSTAKKESQQPDTVKNAGKNSEYVKELIRQTRESEWADVCNIAQAIHKKFPKFDVKKDLGYKRFTDWVDSTELMEKKKTPHSNYYRLKDRKAS